MLWASLVYRFAGRGDEMSDLLEEENATLKTWICGNVVHWFSEDIH